MGEQIFLSYSRRDLKSVQELYSRLVGLGYSVWWDTVDMLPGQTWKAEIHKRMKDASVIIICLSSKWLKDPGYIHEEMNVALELLRQRPKGDIFLIPVKLDDCESPDILSELHWVNVFEEMGWLKLCKSLEIKFQNKQSSVASSASNAGSISLSKMGPVLHVQLAINEALKSVLLTSGLKPPASIVMDALIDTGAALTCVDTQILERLELSPTGFVDVREAFGATSHVCIYHVNVGLSDTTGMFKVYTDMSVLGTTISDGNLSAILGRDLLSHFRFMYDGPSNRFQLF